MLIRGKKLFPGMFFLLTIGLLSTACFDQEDFDLEKLAAVEWSPSYAVKLLNGKMSITDLANDFEEVELRSYPDDGLLYFYYETETESATIGDVIELTDVSLNTSFNSPVDLPGVSLTEDLTLIDESFIVDLGIGGGQIDSIFYSRFPVDFAISSSFDELFELTMTFPTFIQEDGKPISKTFLNDGSGSSQQDEEVFSGFIADLTTQDPAYNKFPVDISLTLKGDQYVTITKGDQISITLDIKNQGFVWVKGYFEPASRMISQEDLSIDLFNTSFTDAEYDLEGTKLTFEISNEFGIPIKLDFKTLNAVNQEGATMPIEIDPASPFTINSPTQIGDNALTTVTVTNPVEVFKFTPSGFQYAIEAHINDGVSSGRNFIAADSKNRVKFSAEIPLWGNADGITLRDTFDIDLNELSEDEISVEPTKFTLKSTIENAYPVDVFVQMVLLDENYNYLDVLLTEEQSLLVEAAETNDTGIVKTGMFDDEIVLEDSKIDKLFDAAHVILISRLRTFTKADGTRPNVKFFEDGYIEADMGIGAKVDIEVKP